MYCIQSVSLLRRWWMNGNANMNNHFYKFTITECAHWLSKQHIAPVLLAFAHLSCREEMSCRLSNSGSCTVNIPGHKDRIQSRNYQLRLVVRPFNQDSNWTQTFFFFIFKFVFFCLLYSCIAYWLYKWSYPHFITYLMLSADSTQRTTVQWCSKKNTEQENFK